MNREPQHPNNPREVSAGGPPGHKPGNPNYLNNKMIDYLLERSSEEEREQLEEQYFNDNEIFIELLETEDSLIKDYLRGNLDPDDRLSFEKVYLTVPCKKEKLIFASLIENSGALELLPPGPQVARAQQARWEFSNIFSFFKLANSPARVFAVLSLLLVVGASLWVFNHLRSQQPRGTIALIGSQRSTVTSEIVAGSQAQVEQVLKLKLIPNTQRSGGATKFEWVKTISPVTKEVELSLRIPKLAYKKYKLSIEKIEDGTVVDSVDSLKPEVVDNENVIVHSIPAANLAPGNYAAHLRGIKENGEDGDLAIYDFTLQSSL